MEKRWQTLTPVDKIFYIWIIFIALIAVAMIVGYLFMFDGGFSAESSDWANASSFFYGILTVLLTALNVFLFYHLTTAANDMNKKSKDASVAIVKSFTSSEKTQRCLSIGMSLYSQYIQSHARLIEILQKTDISSAVVASQLYQIEIAVEDLRGTYLIIKSKSQLFKQTSAYIRHSDYMNILSSLVGTRQQRAEMPENDEENIKQYENHHINNEDPIVELSNHFKEIIKLLTDDLQKLKI